MKAFRLSVVGLLLCAAVAFGAPPALDVPPEVKPVDGYATYQPGADVAHVIYVSLDGLTTFPAAFLKDSRSFVVPTKGEKPGRYRFVAVASNTTGEQSRADFVVVIPGAPVVDPVKPDPDPVNPPKPDPKPDPSAALVPPLYVLVVEEGQKRTPAEGKVIADGAMIARIRAAGHKWRVYDVDDPAAKALGLDKLAGPVGVPFVVVRDSRGADRAFKLPATSADLEATVKGLIK